LLLSSVEEAIQSASRMTWSLFHHVPIQGSLVTGVAAWYAVTVFGVAELLAAGLSAYVTYRMFAYGEPLLEAIQKSIKFEQGQLPMKETTRKIA
jgi:hypothetical protein